MASRTAEERDQREQRLREIKDRLSQINSMDSSGLLALAALELTQQVADLDDNLTVQEGQTARVRRVSAINSALLFVTLAALVIMAVVLKQVHDIQIEQKSHDQCVSKWALATADRSVQLGKLRAPVDGAAQEVVVADDALFASLTNKNLATIFPQVLSVVLAADQDYKQAISNYQDGLKLHPVPPAPTLDCGR